MSKIYRPTWAEINLNHIEHNFNYVANLNPNKQIIPVVKADAYGHGALEVMNFLYQKGINMFAVSLLEEAIKLRNNNKKIKILMLGPILEDQFSVAQKNKIDITLYDTNIVQTLLKTNHKLNVHLKIDTGMNRYGIKDKKEILEIIDQLQTHKTLNLEGVFTHFATANDDKKIYDLQVERFKDILNDIKVKPKMIHISNSSSAIKYEKYYDFTTHIRLGISLYGLSLDKTKTNLKPAMSLKSKVVQIKQLKAGEVVGYGATYTSVTKERIAVIPIGYADGWIRKNRHNDVQINHKRYQIIGLICMDALFVSIDSKVQIGDEVTLFGDLISIDEVAEKQQTNLYEVCTNISKRVPRIYIQGEEK
ncbi:alanine racemase [Mariniplasma anaerobium]|uniref:Alanine racemase n=1 Tax=Mariniplasma anaerobium TaxID=2735436 RepID=A0A7U9TID8_9MOLU|nr:alanine racemase [Mariniplasma anaerobium]BCR35970.1 alanine racemase [Mariniplasma anaerobium]